MGNEKIFFHEGLSYEVRSALQTMGYLQTAKNIAYRKEGQQELRPSYKALNSTAVGAVHSVERFRGRLLIGDGAYLRHNALSGNFTSLGSSFANSIFFAREYKDFLHLVNGTDNLFFDEDGNLYYAHVANPTTAPSGTAGDEGEPSDTYALYVSYLITWPNGQMYETGLSSASDDVEVSSEKITWSAIPVCPYAAVSGTAPTIHRKLYRGPGTGGALGDIYLVTTITDNTTVTYSDNFTDAELAANGGSMVDDYDVPPTTPQFLEYHYSRLFLIDTDNPNRLYYSDTPAGDTSTENEVLRPLSFTLDNWTDLRAAGFGRVDPQGLIAWGTYIYVPLKHTWIRKDGNDPDTWAIKKTWASHGIGAPHTIVPIPDIGGIIGLTPPTGGRPGLAVFNGSTTSLVTKDMFVDLFEDDLNHNSIENCRGAFDGRYYHLLYPSGSNTQPNKHAAFDLSKFPKIRLAMWEDLNSRSMYVDDQTSKVYIGGSDGYVRDNRSGESIDIEVKTHDLIGTMSGGRRSKENGPNQKKVLEKLKYSLNTGGKDVTLEIYLDGSLGVWPDGETTKTITGTDDSVQYVESLPMGWECYKYTIRIYGSDLTTFELFSPWDVTLSVK